MIHVPTSCQNSMIQYLDRWLQHLQSGHSCEHQVGYCDSSQVWSQSQYRPYCPEEWLQFPGQSMHATGQLHLLRQMYFQTHIVKENTSSENHVTLEMQTANLWYDSKHSCIITKVIIVNNLTACNESAYIYKLCNSTCTCWWKSKLSACHSCIRCAPGVITHSAPCVIVADFHSTFVTACTTTKSDVTICTPSWWWRYQIHNSCKPLQRGCFYVFNWHVTFT